MSDTTAFSGIDTIPTDPAVVKLVAELNARLDAAESQVRHDAGWFSAITGIGTEQYDKTMSAAFCAEPVSDEEAKQIYRGDPWGARAVEIRPREMFRPGWELTISDAKVEKKKIVDELKQELPKKTRADARLEIRVAQKRLDALAKKTKALQEKAEKRAEELGVDAKFKQALSWANAYGGSAIVMGALDGTTAWDQELNPDKINSPEKFTWLTVLEAKNLTPFKWYNDPQKDKYGEVAVWRISPDTAGMGQGIDPSVGVKTIDIHESRVLLFQGVKVSRSQSEGTRAGFGDSMYTRLKGVLRRFGLGWNSAAIIINEFSLAVMKIKGLAEMVGSDSQKKLLARMAAVQLGRSVARVTLLDSTEEFTRETASLAGLADLLEKIMQELAGACDVPVTVFMGMSPSGLNATGESDVRGWYDRIAGEFKEKVKPLLSRVAALIMRSLNNGKEAENWSVNLRPLWQESPKEKAETRKIDADTDEKNIMNQIYTAAEARRSRYGGDQYGSEIQIDEDELLGPDDETLRAEDAALNADPNAPQPTPADPSVPKTGSELPKLGSAPAGGAPAPAGNPGDTIPVNAPETPVQNAALNGAQLTSMIEIVKAVANEEIARESGKAALMIGFPITSEQAEALLGPIAFKPKKEEPPAGFAGGFGAKPPGGAPPPNGEAKPDEKKPAPFPPKA